MNALFPAKVEAEFMDIYFELVHKINFVYSFHLQNAMFIINSSWRIDTDNDACS